MSRNRQAAERRGRRAETLAALYLMATGHRILARRMRNRDGEIDLIAKRGHTLIFVEVKQRATAEAAVEPVTAEGERRLLRAAERWLAGQDWAERAGFETRYDLITLTGRWRLSHLRDAFRGW